MKIAKKYKRAAAKLRNRNYENQEIERERMLLSLLMLNVPTSQPAVKADSQSN